MASNRTIVDRLTRRKGAGSRRSFLKRDMENRKNALDESIAGIQNRLKSNLKNPAYFRGDNSALFNPAVVPPGANSVPRGMGGSGGGAGTTRKPTSNDPLGIR